MDEEKPVNRALLRMPPFLRGELRIATTGFAIMAILLGSLWGGAWWLVHAQSASLREAGAEHVRVVGNTLARTIEIMLAENEVSAVRRIVAETARDAGIAPCRIVLPDGKVVADSNPSGITVRDLQPKWSGTAVAYASDGKPSTRVFPLVVPGRGSARLEVTALADPSGAYYRSTQTGIGGISLVALVVLLLLYRRVRAGVQGICAVREALLAREGGQTAPAALEVNPTWGPEAKAWNSLLSEMEKQQKGISSAKAQELLQFRRHDSEQLASACDGLAQGLILIDTSLRATYVNGAAAVLLQAKRGEMLMAEISTFLGEEQVLAAAREATDGRLHGRTVIEVPRQNGDSHMLLRLMVRPMRREDYAAAMIVVEDITQQRVAEESRKAFVTQATHELRTPLTNIRLYTEMALDEGKSDPAILGQCLNVINQETFRLDRMVGDMLSIAEIEAGTLTLRKDDVRLEELFAELAADYEAQAKEKQTQLTFGLPPKLPVFAGDRDKIRLLLHNLLGNALKYTPAGGQVALTAGTAQGRVVVDVADTGIGIREEDHERIFEKFYRASDRRVAAVKGSGLGLAIAREIARLHGGDITVQSVPDKGSTFTLVLPLTGEMT